MSWNNVDTRCRIMYGDQLTSNLKPQERKFIIHTIAEEFPHFSRVRIAASVDHCFKINQGPIPRRTFLTFIQNFLR
ncbi:hypothetical protein EZL74_03925 [Flavobacterium silvisoli]|uniref:Uncharacterized protein n=1 Tax=Flavobacterium silvisoli TaxID=2529433 RepID=A0A4Q9Z2D3_9FLAO|nr:hypothetical protein [Flavobacterium silvisoli]TBX70332.1 hypothetical protein EZL74_03925 [Flavobacterium silvisoli]